MNSHPYAALFPLVEGEEFERLTADIRDNGLLEPIVTLGDAILDGRNRYRACQAAGVAPRFEAFRGDEAAALAFVLSKNIHRRHLTSSQRAVLALEVEPLFAEAAKKRLSPGINQYTQRSPEIFRETSKGEAAEQAADAVGTNARYVQYAKKLQAEAPELVERVRAGEISLPEANRMVTGVNNAYKLRALGSSESNEWYTPRKYIEAARAVMGGIDVDPASNPVANRWIEATTYYSAEDDGLIPEWHGRIWLNPPYGGGQALFVNKLMHEVEVGHVTEAIVLVNAHATDTNWFAPLWDYVLCFTDHRINFVAPTNEARTGSNHGSVFIYIGPHHLKFASWFEQFGVVVTRYRVPEAA